MQTVRLALAQVQATGGRTPRFFTLGPDGRWLYALNEDSDTIARLAVYEATGHLTPTGDLLLDARRSAIVPRGVDKMDLNWTYIGFADDTPELRAMMEATI